MKCFSLKILATCGVGHSLKFDLCYGINCTYSFVILAAFVYTALVLFSLYLIFAMSALP